MNLDNFTLEELKKEIEKRTDQTEETETSTIVVFMYGNDGCEGAIIAKEPKDLEPLFVMRMRARFNSHRNIEVYGVKFDHDVTRDKFYDNIDNYPELVLKKSIKLGF